MLSSLQIENVAVIQKANVHFEKGLNVLTGETGAGKSILIDSINAILGNRTSKDLVRTGAAKAVIRAAFEDVPPVVLDSLEKAGYERSEALLLSREITAEGKSTCRINGMPATAAVLRELCGGLININGQHDSVGLLNPARHEGILDAYAQNSAEYQAYYAIYRELVGVKKTLDAMITDESEKQRRIDLLSYQVQEIDDAGLTAGEEQTLESRRKVLANASTIRDRIAQCYALLSGGDEAPGAVDLLGEASNAVDAAAQLDGELSAGAGQLLDLYYTAKDVAADLIGRLDAYDTNDAELDEIEQRIDLIYKLRRKYGDTVEDILAFGERARTFASAARIPSSPPQSPDGAVFQKQTQIPRQPVQRCSCHSPQCAVSSAPRPSPYRCSCKARQKKVLSPCHPSRHLPSISAYAAPSPTRAPTGRCIAAYVRESSRSIHFPGR